MSTLDINKKAINKTIKIYFICSIISLIFSIIYLHFSFGVSSYFIKYLALIPLVLGSAVYFILNNLPNVKHNRLSFNLYNASIFTLSIGSIIQGVLEICGSHSFYTPIYLITGILLIIVSLVNFIISNK